MKNKVPKILLGIVIVLSLAAMIGGITITKGPFYQHWLRMDKTRANDLRQLKNYIAEFYKNHGALPASLEILRNDLETQRSIGLAGNLNTLTFKDPAAKQPYQYHKHSDTTFSLCANFELDTTQEQSRTNWSSNYLYSYDGRLTQHPKGLTCYRAQLKKSVSAQTAFEWVQNP